MAEPEEILLDGAQHATRFVQRLWRQRTRQHEPEVLELAECRARLELFIRAAFGISLTVGPADPPLAPSWLRRWALRIPRHLAIWPALAETDGAVVRLPASVATGSGSGSGWSFYRLSTAQMAARAERQTPAWLPADPLARDLYLLSEAECVDHLLATELPGLGPELQAGRRAALAGRPSPLLLTAQESAVETLISAVLNSELRGAAVASASPQQSRLWAEGRAAEIRALGGTYRGLPPVALWGYVRSPAPSRGTAGVPAGDDARTGKPRVTKMRRRPRVRQAPEDEDDESVGLWMIQLDDPQEHVEDPMGLQRPTDRDAEADPEGLADSLAELPEARLVTSPEAPREILVSDDPPAASALASRGVVRPGGYVYPEWDYRTGGYHEHGAVVREHSAQLGDPDWARGVFARRALLLAEVRRRFERLRARRLRLARQLDGFDIDLDAYVASQADRLVGRPGDDRLYVASRPARRDLAITVLVDTSGSTDSWVTENLRIVDVEREALLVVCTALVALGDPFAIQAFSGQCRDGVSIALVKSFEEPAGAVVNQRIAGLEPDRFTRLGAALRHASASLSRRTARHRLLLVLSDGKPNDVDLYEGRYGVEDTRQAITEARLQGIHPFCLTVDRQAPSYMPRMFGAGHFSVLHHPVQLPGALVQVLRGLIQG